MIRVVIYLGLLSLIVAGAPLEEPVYSRHCRNLKNKRGKVVGVECLERFKTRRRPPGHGLQSHKAINEFLALDLMNQKQQTPHNSTTYPREISVEVATTTRTRPTISANPIHNTNPDYTYLWPTPTIVKKPSSTSTNDESEILEPTTTPTPLTTTEPSTSTRGFFDFGFFGPKSTTTEATRLTTSQPSTTTEVEEDEIEVLTASTTTALPFGSSKEILEKNYDSEYEEEDEEEATTPKDYEEEEDEEEDVETETEKTGYEDYEYE